MKTDVCGVNFDNVNMDEAVSICKKLINTGRGAYVVTPNPEIVYACRNDPEAGRAVGNAALVVPDGVGIILAAKILSTPLKEKVAGIELGEHVINYLAESGKTLYILGGRPSVAEKASCRLHEKYGLSVVGTHDGYFTDDTEIINDIKDKHPDVLFVCMGAPRQEKWMAAHSETLNVPLMLGLGGSVDIYAGISSRAPKLFIKLGLEWFYRLLKEPRRFKRMLVLPKFLFLALKIRISGDNKNES